MHLAKLNCGIQVIITTLVPFSRLQRLPQLVPVRRTVCLATSQDALTVHLTTTYGHGGQLSVRSICVPGRYHRRASDCQIEFRRRLQRYIGSFWIPGLPRFAIADSKLTGELQSVDGYMNIALEKCDEYVNGNLRRSYGDAFVRGNNGELFRKHII